MKAFFPHEEYEQRWQKVHGEMADRSLEAAVIWGRSGGTYERHGDVLYLCNYYSSQSGHIWDGMSDRYDGAAFSAVLLRRGHSPTLIADESPHVELISTDDYRWSYKVTDELIKVLNEFGVSGTVGFVGSDFYPMNHWSYLRDATTDITWAIHDDLVRDVRVIKSDRELDAYREAGQTVTAGLTALVEGLLSGMSEADAAGEAAREVVRRGGHPHMIPISHGEHIHYFSSDPVPAYSKETPKQGDLVRCWVYGPMCQGYWLDPGRTFVIGRKPTAAQKKLIESTAKIVEDCMALIKPGTTVNQVVQLGEKLHQEFGGVDDEVREKWGDVFGHGVGLFWDEPLFSRYYAGKHTEIKQNMVISTETFMAFPDVGSAGFEQNFIVTSDGTELLTTTPMRWY